MLTPFAAARNMVVLLSPRFPRVLFQPISCPHCDIAGRSNFIGKPKLLGDPGLPNMGFDSCFALGSSSTTFPIYSTTSQTLRHWQLEITLANTGPEWDLKV